MNNSQLTPRTEFIVYNKKSLGETDRIMFNDIYMPLIGPVAASIYMYMHDSKKRFKPLEVRLHREFIDEINISLSTFNDNIVKLEALGLIKTYVNDDEHEDQIIYEAKTPLDADDFFKDPMLSMFLFTKVGSQAFNSKREFWLYPKLPKNITNVSRKFTEVFSNLSLGKFKENETFVSDNPSYGSNVDLDDFDFDVLLTHLRGTFVDRKFFTKTVRLNIVKLAELFNLTAYDMKSIVIKATNKTEGIDLNILRRAALDYFRREQPKESQQVEKVVKEKDNDSNETEKNYFQILDTTSPITRIHQLRHNKVSKSDEQLVTNLVTQTRLSNGVINVLLEYALLQKQGMLYDNYVFKIARDWEDKGYQTAEEAKEAAMKFYHNQRTAKNNPYVVSKKSVEPKWFNEDKTNNKHTAVKKEDNKNKKSTKKSKDIMESIDRFRKL